MLLLLDLPLLLSSRGIVVDVVIVVALRSDMMNRHRYHVDVQFLVAALVRRNFRVVHGIVGWRGEEVIRWWRTLRRCRMV